MTAPTRTALAQQTPVQYAAQVFARLLRTIDLEFVRLTQFTATVTWNPASIADGDNATTTVTVTGVRAGIRAHVRVFPPYSLQGLIAGGYVSADDTVTICLNNNTGGAVDLGSGVWGVAVENFVFT
ncbi:MAG TPA: hypothetical protein VD994_03725 [Prosthecobacter sp.]|nr:hypothetical protein [Prosthecobacter sp.]